MTDAATMPTRADAQFVHDEWDRRTRAHDIEGLLELYLPDATLESPLVPRVLDQTSGVLHGHDELRTFFVRGTEGRPNDLVRWYRTGEFMFDKRTLIWEYPRQAPEWEQVDLKPCGPSSPRWRTWRPQPRHGAGGGAPMRSPRMLLRLPKSERTSSKSASQDDLAGRPGPGRSESRFPGPCPTKTTAGIYSVTTPPAVACSPSRHSPHARSRR
jgi:hypothetical protein